MGTHNVIVYGAGKARISFFYRDCCEKCFIPVVDSRDCGFGE